MRAARSLTPRTPPATGDVAFVWRARPLVPLGERYDVCRAPGRLNPGGDIVSVLERPDLVHRRSASRRSHRSPDAGPGQPRPITECWRIHQTNFRHILNAPPEPRRTISVGEYPSFSGFSQLYTVIHLNLAYRWFCRLGLDGDVPDHSTFSKNRHGRFRESDLLRKLFETIFRLEERAKSGVH
jgi:hypothetical protein